MKASELIERLERHMNVHGDVDIKIYATVFSEEDCSLMVGNIEDMKPAHNTTFSNRKVLALKSDIEVQEI